jgi:hypothetical protein
VNVPDELRAWLDREHVSPPDADAGARAADALQERLLSLTRALRPRQADVAGSLVLHDASGQPFAATHGARILIRGTTFPAALEAEPVEGVPGWASVTPEPTDITFARGADVLRDALRRAVDTTA